MHVFVTGASGWVGSAVVPELIKAGHQVTGLARSKESGEKLKAAGVEVLEGSLDDIDILRTGAEKADGVIHLAFGHDFSKFAESCEIDRRTIETFGEVLAGTGRPLVVTSGILLLPPGKVTTEEDAADTNAEGMVALRAKSEVTALALASKDLRVSIVRLPPSVHGDGDAGFLPMIINVARTKGESSYIGDGTNCWTSVHVLDAGNLYRLALESAPAGSILHAVADGALKIRDIATVIGQGLDLPVGAKSSSEAGDHFGFMAHLLSINAPSSSAITRKLLNWNPVQVGLLDDISQPHYLKPAADRWT